MSADNSKPMNLNLSSPEPPARGPRKKAIRVLIVEDEPDWRKLCADAVGRMGLIPLPAADLSGARRILARHPVRLVLLDRLLGEGVDGLGLCLDLKKDPRTRLVPVIVLTGTNQFEDEIRAIRYGADLCLRKPVEPRRLQKYIEALLGRLPYKEEAPDAIRYGPFVLSKADHTIRVGRTVYRDLPERQFELLALLVTRQGGCVSRRWLVSKLWRNQVRDREVDVLVSRLRRRLGRGTSSFISPVRSHGYCVALPSSAGETAAAE